MFFFIHQFLLSMRSQCTKPPETMSLSHGLENIDENEPASWVKLSCAPPETPTESMEFLARSWSLSAMELSNALSNNTHNIALNHLHTKNGNDANKPPFSSVSRQPEDENSMAFRECNEDETNESSPPISPRDSEEMKELFLLHQALHPEFLSNQQLLRNGLYKSILRGRTMGRWLKDQKERKKQEIRTHNAQLHAAVSVAGVAAAIASITASKVATLQESLTADQMIHFKTTASVASAAALVASHCLEIAKDMGADHDQILAVVNSAISARTNGDIMTLTAGAATALRGAATLRTRLQKGCGATYALAEEKVQDGKELNISAALNFVSRGEELLKRTRKGDLHWKQVSFDINVNLQVVAKMKSKHMAGTFTKTKKFIIFEVYGDIPTWPGRERDDAIEQRAYFGIKTADRIIEFECQNKEEKQMWIAGVKHMLNCCYKMKQF